MVLIAVGGFAAAVVVGPFVYIHFVEGPAPAPLRAGVSRGSAAATASTVGSAGTLDGAYAVGSGSQAGYRVGEVLYGQNATAVGRTSAVTGTLTVTGGAVSTATVSVDLTTVKSDQAQRDRQFQGRIMQTRTYPSATFTLTQPIGLGGLPADGATLTRQATGTLVLHGTTRPITVTVTVKRAGGGFEVSGSIPVVFAEYGIDNPSGGPATTQDHGTVEFLLELVRT